MLLTLPGCLHDPSAVVASHYLGWAGHRQQYKSQATAADQGCSVSPPESFAQRGSQPPFLLQVALSILCCRAHISHLPAAQCSNGKLLQAWQA